MRHLRTSVYVLITVAAGCASYPAPTQKMVEAESSIRGAQEVGADRFPQAQLQVKLAQEQVDKAKKLTADGDNERAEWMLKRARADAELGLALAKEENAKTDAQKSIEELKTLKEKLK